MSSETLELLQLEIQDHREKLAPQFEGFEDLAMVDLQDATMLQVGMDISDARIRTELIDAAASALSALADDGYPDLPIIKVKDTIYADLAEQKRTIDAALARYAPLPPEAVGGLVEIVSDADIQLVK